MKLCFLMFYIYFNFRSLMKSVLNELRVIIKRDLMKKMGTTIAFNALDQWWEEAERQSKVMLIYLN